eukprot:1138440-Prorocentrum_minimum.AAC.1
MGGLERASASYLTSFHGSPFRMPASARTNQITSHHSMGDPCADNGGGPRAPHIPFSLARLVPTPRSAREYFYVRAGSGG